MINLSLAGVIEIIIDLILVSWIMIASVRSLKNIAPVPTVKQLDLMKGIWKLETALGLALYGLAGLGIITAICFPLSFGILILLITLAVFILTYQATKDLERVPTIAGYV